MAIEKRLELIDFEWSGDGDFVIRNGDISDTENSIGMAFTQEIEDRTKSSIEDWKLLPGKGANLEDFEGQINNESTWKKLEAAIDFSFTKDGFLDQSDFVVTAAPVSNTEVAIRIDFNASLTNIIPDSKIVIKVVFDLEGQGPFIVR